MKVPYIYSCVIGKRAGQARAGYYGDRAAGFLPNIRQADDSDLQ